MKKIASSHAKAKASTIIKRSLHSIVVLFLLLATNQVQAQRLLITDYHVAILCADGNVYSWGNNQGGQHGNGTVSQLVTPSRLQYEGPISGIYAHTSGASLVTPAGDAYAWGGFTNASIVLGVPSWESLEATPRKVASVFDVRKVIGSETEFYFITNSDSVLVTGHNDAGQYGNGTVVSQDSGTTRAHVGNVEQLYANLLSVFAIRRDGSLVGWGGNGYSMIDSSGRELVDSPVEMLPDLRFRAGCSSRDNQYRFITINGDLIVWGRNRFGMLGSAEEFVSAAKKIPLPGKAVSVAGGDDHTAVLLDDGTVVSFGSNEYGQLGRLYDGDGKLIESSSIPVVATNLKDVVEICAARNTTLALTKDGTLYGWGQNNWYQIEQEGPRTFPFPARILMPCEIATGMIESTTSARISIAPNPAYHSFDVQFSDAAAYGEVSVYNMQGIRLLGPIELHDGRTTIPLHSIETGVYHVVVTARAGAVHQQLVVLK